MLPNGPYDPKTSEAEILKNWLDNKMYKPEYDPKSDRIMSTEEMKNDPRTPWALICPPPNAYARPHIGNISGYAYQDAMARYQRMKGKKVLVLPGKDHAGLEGEGVFVREVLEKQGRNKFDMKREDFYKEMMEFFMKNIDIARNDERNIGLSADFDRDTFTLDPDVVETVLDTFVEMYNQGMIYKGVRIVNWDPKARSAVADNQTVREAREGKLYFIKYPLADNKDEFITVATTRPETMFGDTAVAVNPDDERFKNLVGKKVIIPLTDIEIPIITSFRVEKDFGTGCLKITPAHSQDDFQIMQEWNKDHSDQKISYRNVIGQDLKLTGTVPEKFRGVKYKEALPQIIEDLNSAGLLVKEEKTDQNILIAERTRAQIEPLMSSQWYLKYDGIKEGAIDMVKNGELKIHPENMVQKFNHWMENLRDWAISRSLWWGYRMPVWYAGPVKEEINENGEVKELIRLSSSIEKNTNNILIRKAEAEDSQVMYEIDVEGWMQNFIDEARGITNDVLINKYGKKSGEQNKIAEFGKMIEDENNIFYVAEKDGKVIGWVNLENLKNNEIKWLNIYIDKDYQKQGIGRLLMNKILSDYGHLEIHIATPEKANFKGFYSKFGFVEYPVEGRAEGGLYMIQMKREPSDIGNWVPLEYNNPNHIRVQKENPDSIILDVIRHGETDENLKEIISGQNDALLNKEGRDQAGSFKLNDNYDLIITSTLSRAKETAEIISEGKIPVVENDLLIERNFGELQGKTWEEFENEYPQLAKKNSRNFQPELPSGESIPDIEARVERFLDEVKEKYSGKKILVVTHTGIIRILKRKLGEQSYDESRSNDPANLKLTRFEVKSKISHWIQDENVLDTWFSSGQWVYATLAKWGLMDTFFPTDVLVSASDILENWDSRMMMFTYFKHKNIPFRDLFLTGLVLGSDGQKMSKSKGNIVDMDKVVNDYGTDSVRLAYFYQNSAGGSYVISNDKLKNFKQFNNKIWNAARFVFMNLDENTSSFQLPASLQLELSKQMISHIKEVKEKVTKNIDNFEFGYATETLYDKFWHTFCDIEIEQSKEYVGRNTSDVERQTSNEDKQEIVSVLVYVLKEYLKMLHPFIPFITERIWQEVPKTDEDHKSLMYTRW